MNQNQRSTTTRVTRQRGPRAVVATTVTTTTNARTNRNRRRRQRQRANRRAWTNVPPVISQKPIQRLVARENTTPSFGSRRRIGSLISMTDQQALRGTEHMLDSLFVGETGISRGIAFGSDLSALTKFKGTFDVNLPANGQLNMVVVPSQLQAPAWINYTTDAQSAFAGGINPFSTTPVTQAAFIISGPFANTNPGVGWRVVRFALRCTPTTAMLNQGGFANVAHVPIIATGPPALATFVGQTTTGQLQNMEMQRTFGGLDRWIYQWYPNQAEVEITSTSNQTLTNSPGWSGVQLYIMGPNQIVNFHFEWEVGIEYVPNATYRPYVERKLPDMHPDALFYMNQFVSKHWIPAVLATVHEWEKFVQALEPMVHTYSESYQLANRVGFISDYGKHAVYEEEKADGDGYSIINEACERAERMFGINPCEVNYSKAVNAGLNYLAGGRMNPFPTYTPLTN
jgi:hypothetical protein